MAFGFIGLNFVRDVALNAAVPPSLEGRGWEWVGRLWPLAFDNAEADPPPAPPFQGGGKSWAGHVFTHERKWPEVSPRPFCISSPARHGKAAPSDLA